MGDSGKYRCRATNVDGMSATSNEAELISKKLHVYRIMLHVMTLLSHSFPTNNYKP